MFRRIKRRGSHTIPIIPMYIILPDYFVDDYRDSIEYILRHLDGVNVISKDYEGDNVVLYCKVTNEVALIFDILDTCNVFRIKR